MNIVQAITELKNYLNNKLIADKYWLQYKSTAVPDEFETAVPAIYAFTCPSSELVNSYPAKCPAIVVTLDGRNNYLYDVTLNLCVSNSSLSDKEVAYPVENNINVYELGTDGAYNTSGDDDLIVESILFTDQIYNYIANYTAVDISNLSVEYADCDLPDYPYAVSSVSFKMSINIANIGARVLDDLY